MKIKKTNQNKNTAKSFDIAYAPASLIDKGLYNFIYMYVVAIVYCLEKVQRCINCRVQDVREKIEFVTVTKLL